MRAAAADAQAEPLEQTRDAAINGVKIVQWSENAAPVMADEKPAFLGKVSALARSQGIYINAAIGVPFERNETYLFEPDGRQLWHYRKNYPVPGMEPVAPVQNAAPQVATPFGRLTNAICYDADFPALTRVPADTMLLPGWDWREEVYIHSLRIARLRAIENGYSMLRVDYNGLRAAFDPYGRVIGIEDTLDGARFVMTVDLPMRAVRTVYATTGDAFASLCLLAVIGLVGMAMVRPTEQSRRFAGVDRHSGLMANRQTKKI